MLKDTIHLALLVILQIGIAHGQVTTYNYPGDIPEDDNYQVSVNGEAQKVYGTPIAGVVTYGSTGATTVEVVTQFAFEQVVIRPLKLNIQAKIMNDRQVQFTLPADTKVSVEFDHRIYMPLFVFSQKPVSSELATTATIIYEAGKRYTIENKRIKTGDRVWVQAGAVLKGTFLMEDVEDVIIFGHGIIDNRDLTREEGYYGLGWMKARNSSVSNLHLIGNPRWSTSYFGCKNIRVNDMRIIGWRRSDDGIDVVGSEDITIENTFVRTKDDCLAIKASEFWYKVPDPEGVPFTVPKTIGCKLVNNVTMKNCTLWNAEWGNAIEIGFETRADTMQSITIENVDIIHVEANGGALTIHNGDRAHITDVLYKDIRIEEAYGYLCHFQVLFSHYSKDKERGSGSNIVMDNIQVVGGAPLNSIITGLDAEHQYEDIKFRGLTIHGKKIKDVKDGNIYTEHAEVIVE